MPLKRIAYIPFEKQTNAYADRMRELLSVHGTVVPFGPSRQVLLQWLVRPRVGRFDSVVVNWTENSIIRAPNRRVSMRRVLRLFAKLLVMRLTARRLLFVRHNRYPHDTAGGEEARATRWVERYARSFDLVLTHSPVYADVEHRYCPHPLYRREAAIPADASAVQLPEEYFAVFGRITSYKRIVELIDAFPRDKCVVVMGPVSDEVCGRQLADRQRENFVFLPGFRPEAEAQAILRGAQAVVIAHADSETVSGTFFYAMSLLVPVLAVETPFLRWAAARIGSNLVTLSGDMQGLCRTARSFRRPAVAPESAERIEQEFGDAAVSAALAGALAG